MSDSNTPAPRALIVEDEPVTQKFVRLSLEKCGIACTTCEDGATALYHYIQQPHFDVVILDIMMPEVGGDDFIKVAQYLHKEKLVWAPSRIIIHTAIGNLAHVESYNECECVHSVLQKPVSKAELFRHVFSVLDMHGTSGPLSKLFADHPELLGH